MVVGAFTSPRCPRLYYTAASLVSLFQWLVLLPVVLVMAFAAADVDDTAMCASSLWRVVCIMQSVQVGLAMCEHVSGARRCDWWFARPPRWFRALQTFNALSQLWTTTSLCMATILMLVRADQSGNTNTHGDVDHERWCAASSLAASLTATLRLATLVMFYTFNQLVLRRVDVSLVAPFVRIEDNALWPSRDRGLRNGEIATGAGGNAFVLSRHEADDVCSVCLCDMETGESVRRLPCHHLFHAACIDPWLRVRPRCSLCVQSVRVKPCAVAVAVVVVEVDEDEQHQQTHASEIEMAFMR